MAWPPDIGAADLVWARLVVMVAMRPKLCQTHGLVASRSGPSWSASPDQWPPRTTQIVASIRILAEDGSAD